MCGASPMVCVSSMLTPEVLVVVVSLTTGGAQHQGISMRGSGGPQDPINVSAMHHLTETDRQTEKRMSERKRRN